MTTPTPDNLTAELDAIAGRYAGAPLACMAQQANCLRNHIANLTAQRDAAEAKLAKAMCCLDKLNFVHRTIASDPSQHWACRLCGATHPTNDGEIKHYDGCLYFAAAGAAGGEDKP